MLNTERHFFFLLVCFAKLTVKEVSIAYQKILLFVFDRIIISWGFDCRLNFNYKSAIV